MHATKKKVYIIVIKVYLFFHKNILIDLFLQFFMLKLH